MTKSLSPNFPGMAWEAHPPTELGFDSERLEQAGRKIAERAGDGPFCVAVVRHGYLAAAWHRGVAPNAPQRQASAAKSLYGSLLGIAVAEGRISSLDAKVAEVYPEMMDVPDGAGPKPGRFARPKAREITFRQLITNTSGYLKPDERPGEVFHYQTFGMNVLMHAIGKAYGVYDANDPEGSAGPGELIREKIRDPIGGAWTWRWTNFEHGPKARLGIFGYYTQLFVSCHDQLRLGWLWLQEGCWDGREVVPASFLRQATVTAAAVRRHAPEEQGAYGHGFWTNDYGRLWPSLPRDSFAASGAGSRHIWVCPSLDLVVAQNPGPWKNQKENDPGPLRWIADALRP